MSLLDKIKESSDLKKYPEEQLSKVAEEIRQEIISVVSTNGGHLASNLGVVELTLALHYCFDIPTDKIVWDVGHQSYVHKILTGRRDRLKTIRQYDGLSGFPKRTESPADAYGAGHASTAISSSLGLAIARDQLGLKHKIIAVVGDGAMTGGLAFEGLNNAGTSKKDILVVLNDNEMSISRNVGALSKYLTTMMTDKRFNKLRDDIWELTGRFKRRDKIRATVADIERSVKALFVPGYLFDKLGFRYYGPIDGHDIPLLIRTLTQIKDLPVPKFLHVVTVKGKGFRPAEDDATKFHGIGAFDKITGKLNSKSGLPSYTTVFGNTMVELAENNSNVVAITAAMCSGTGLTRFSEKFPDRFYDVGIAEGHASCFAAGMAAGGLRPYVAIYSTFLQRAYDQIIHDVALQHLPVVFCLDRAGLVGEDGPTHHGAFDLSYLAPVPDLTVMAPADGDELRGMLHTVQKRELKGPCAIRFPRAAIPRKMTDEIEKIEWGKWKEIFTGGETVVIATGTMVETAIQAHESFDGEIDFALINARFIKPFDTEILEDCRTRYNNIIVLEENAVTGGLGQMVGSYLSQKGYKGYFESIAIPDKFVTHGKRDLLLKEIGLDTESLVQKIREINSRETTPKKKMIFNKSEVKKIMAAVHHRGHNKG